MNKKEDADRDTKHINIKQTNNIMMTRNFKRMRKQDLEKAQERKEHTLPQRVGL